MEHRGIEYTILARPGRDKWVSTIYPKGFAAIKHNFFGTRNEAIAAACRSIDRRLEKSRQRPEA
jgi:hypothetical protein